MAKNITFSGICCAISAVLLLMTNVFTFNTAFLLCGAAAVFPIVKIRCGSGYAASAVFVSCVLGFIFMADKIFVVTFAALAIYSLLKGVIERLDKIWAEWILKGAVYFLIAAAILKIFMPALLWQGILAGAVFFVIYDVALSVFITFARRKLRI